MNLPRARRLLSVIRCLVSLNRTRPLHCVYSANFVRAMISGDPPASNSASRTAERASHSADKPPSAQSPTSVDRHWALAVGRPAPARLGDSGCVSAVTSAPPGTMSSQIPTGRCATPASRRRSRDRSAIAHRRPGDRTAIAHRQSRDRPAIAHRQATLHVGTTLPQTPRRRVRRVPLS